MWRRWCSVCVARGGNMAAEGTTETHQPEGPREVTPEGDGMGRTARAASPPRGGAGSATAVRLAVPSKGNMEEPTLAFLAACGLRVQRDSPRQYDARVAGHPALRTIFQRPSDIPPKLADGIVDVGITGYDIFREYTGDGADVAVAVEDLGYARCELVLAVPEAWIDVSSLRDLV